MLDLEIVNEDITKLDVDCIIAPVGPDWLPVYEVGASIYEAAGYEELREACLNHKGYVCMTPGFQLNAKNILHVKIEEEQNYAPGIRWYMLGISASRAEKTVALPFLTTASEAGQIREMWRAVLQKFYVWGSHFQKEKHIFFTVQDEAILQMGQEVLHEIQEEWERKLAEQALMDNVNRVKLAECIEMLCRIRKIEWSSAKQMESGAWQPPYPQYPKEIFDVFRLMEPDYQYRDHLTQMKKQKLRFSELSLSQIQTYLTYLHRGERFCDGLIAEAVNHGTLLKLLLRIHDLINPYPW